MSDRMAAPGDVTLVGHPAYRVHFYACPIAAAGRRALAVTVFDRTAGITSVSVDEEGAHLINSERHAWSRDSW